MRKKISSMALYLLLICAIVIGGCSSNNGGDQTQDTATNNESKQTDAGKDQSGAPKYSEHMDISIAQWDAAAWETTPEDDWISELGKKFNVTFKKVALTWDDWNDKVQLWAASGNLPDMFVHSQNYSDWVGQGLLKAIPVSQLEQYPFIKRNIKENVLDAMTVDGNIYSIPVSNFADASQAVSLNATYVRKDFLNKAGLDTPPDTLEGWYDFLKKAVDEDFSGTGKTIGLKADSLLLTLPFTHTSDSWVQEDGKWIPTAFSKTHIDELKFSRKLFQEGILDKDFAVRKLDAERKVFQQGRMAVIEANGDPGMIHQQITADMGNIDPQDIYTLALPPKAADGNRYFPYTLNFGNYMGIGPKVSDAKLERILDILNYLGSPEGQVYSVYGVQDKDFKSKDGSEITSVEQSDNVISLLPAGPSGQAKTLQEVKPSSWFGNAALSWNTWVNFINPVFSPEIRQMSNEYFDKVRSQTTIVDPNLQIRFMSSKEKNKMPDLGALYRDLYVQVVMSNKDVETMFNDWVREQTKKVDAAIKEVNDNLK